MPSSRDTTGQRLGNDGVVSFAVVRTSNIDITFIHWFKLQKWPLYFCSAILRVLAAVLPTIKLKVLSGKGCEP